MAITTTPVRTESLPPAEARPTPEVLLQPVSAKEAVLQDILTKLGDQTTLEATVLKTVLGSKLELTDNPIAKILLQLGDNIGGQTLEVSSPQALPIGAKLLLSIIQNEESTAVFELLKVLSSPQGTAQGNHTSPLNSSILNETTKNLLQNLFEQIFKEATPELTLDSLRQLISSESIVKNSIAKNTAPKVEGDESLIKKLFNSPKSDGTVLKESHFKSTEKLVSFLKEFASQQVKPESAATPPTPEKVKIDSPFSKLIQEIKTLQSELATSSTQPQLSQALPIIQSLESLLHPSLNQANSPFEELQGATKNALLKFLPELKEALLNLVKGKTTSGTSQHASISKQLTTLQDLLNRALNEVGLEKQEHTGSQAQNIQSGKTATTESKNGRKQTDPLKMLENFIQGQDALRRLNPLMSQIGEPMFLLIPGFLQGLMQNLEIRYFGSPELDGEGKKNGSGGGYHRMALAYTFPNLGKVRIDSAHRGKHLLLSFSSENEAVVDFIDEHLYRLRKPLYELGFTSQEFMTRKALPDQKSIRPQWLDELTGTERIA